MATRTPQQTADSTDKYRDYAVMQPDEGEAVVLELDEHTAVTNVRTRGTATDPREPPGSETGVLARIREAVTRLFGGGEDGA